MIRAPVSLENRFATWALFAAAVGCTDPGIKGIRPEGPGMNPTDTQRVLNEGRPDHVGIPIVWEYWEPANAQGQRWQPPCELPTDFEYDGHCFRVRTIDDETISDYAAAGVSVTAFLFGAPTFAASSTCAQHDARPCNDPKTCGPGGNQSCGPNAGGCAPNAGGQRWCAPADPADFARFAGFVASYFGNEVQAYHIENEVNAGPWFDVGCTGPNAPFASCKDDPVWRSQWISDYAAVYNASYDAILAENPTAQVFIPFTHYYGSELGVGTASRTYGVGANTSAVKTTFSGTTSDGEVLVYPVQPAESVQFISIETTTTPAWVAWYEIEVLSAGANVALGATATASKNVAIAHQAIDGDPVTMWNTGGGPPAWIEIDLGAPTVIDEVRLHVAQSPSGTTVHNVLFGKRQDEVTITDFPHIPTEDFLRELVPQISPPANPRTWRVAMHPYNNPLDGGSFSPEDYPYITMGSIGAFVGKLRQEYGDIPAANDVHLGESGYAAGSIGEAVQAQLMCDSLRNTLATPGIDAYLYHHLIGTFGILNDDAERTPKLAWDVWANANSDDPDIGKDCGYEMQPLVAFNRYHNSATNRHWQSARVPAPDGFGGQTLLGYVYYTSNPGVNHALYECRTTYDVHNFISTDPNCEQQRPLGPVGYVYTEPNQNTVPLLRCNINGGADHIVGTGMSFCDPYTFESVLGHIVAGSAEAP